MYDHPSAALFRAIELKAVYEQAFRMTFRQPSLDIGCGDGKITQMLFDDQFTYGVDNGEADDVDIAIKNNVYKKVLIESAEKMSLSDGSVSFVFSNSVIEHIPDNGAVLSEISRVLEGGGDFVFTSPSHLFSEYLYIPRVLRRLGLGFLASFYIKKRNQMLNHYHILSHETWTKRLMEHHLKVVKHAYYIPDEALCLWDIMAVQIFMAKLFGMNIENILAKKYALRVQNHYRYGTDDPSKGASVYIHAVKV